MGFELNPYDPCVENNMSNRQQLTVVWKIGDLKFSYVDAKKVTKGINDLEEIYSDMRLSLGTRHK